MPTDVTARLLGCYGITLTPTIPVSDAGEAERAAGRTGLPAVLEAIGPTLVHKSNIGVVRLNLATAKEAGRSYCDLAAALGGRMPGAIVQRMLPGGVNYPAFGPLVMAGIGGVSADLLADRAFRVPPLGLSGAMRMLDEPRCRPLLYGYRGSRPIHVRALATCWKACPKSSNWTSIPSSRHLRGHRRGRPCPPGPVRSAGLAAPPPPALTNDRRPQPGPGALQHAGGLLRRTAGHRPRRRRALPSGADEDDTTATRQDAGSGPGGPHEHQSPGRHDH
ncbi:acetate--CoA ligase family protein [Spongiactinospora sp. 9N601]|uniref:acetate--CoA ligase family protein n=1 Tax=Spongiactinospora sp. 9N601 TaxID=3375149 RepID=UPI0037AD1203